MIQFNEWMAGIYLACGILIAIACLYAAMTQPRHPFTVITLAIVFSLALRQVWWAAALPLSVVGAVASVTEEENASPIASIPAQPGAITANWQQTWPNVARWQPEIEEAASQCRVNSALIAAVMTQESAGHAATCSSAGACGLMQLMPGTASDLNVQDRMNPAQSTRGGACYLRRLLDRYDNDLQLAVAAYNAGPGNVDRYGGVPPFKETQLYVNKVLGYYQNFAVSAQPEPEVIPPVACCQWPVAIEGVLTQQPSATHMAIDIAAPLGTALLASHPGQVIAVGWGGDYGKRIIIDHGNGLHTLYAHLSSFTVTEGEHVQANQMIGRVGSTGRSTGPHLHFEVRKNGILQNPWTYLSKKTT